jgi:hypothetical protein
VVEDVVAAVVVVVGGTGLEGPIGGGLGLTLIPMPPGVGEETCTVTKILVAVAAVQVELTAAAAAVQVDLTSA